MGLKIDKLKAKVKGINYLPFKQDGVTYNLYEMPKGFVIKGNLDLSNKNLTELPDLSEVVIKGSFYCSHNQLTILKGAPQEVGGYFDCEWNELTTLEGAPQEVGGDFCCSSNLLTTLEGVPREVGGGFFCERNELTSLEGAPQKVGGDFCCYNNELTSLEGGPEFVGGNYYCYHNRLTNLEGAPAKVGGNFVCHGNRLTMLFGISPLKEDARIYCDDLLGQKYVRQYVDWVSYKDLIESPLYKSEAGAANIRRKRPPEQEKLQEPEKMTEEEKQHQEKLRQKEQTVKAAYEAWCKEHGIEPKAR